MSHTPGPWHVQEILGENGYTFWRVFIKTDPVRDAHDLLDLKNEADARLIAAAPELLEIIDKIHFSDTVGDEREKYYRRMLELHNKLTAITRATKGEKQP